MSKALELASLVDEIRAECPEMSLSDAVQLAAASLNAEMFEDLVIILGDCADALNDMRPAPGAQGTVH